MGGGDGEWGGGGGGGRGGHSIRGLAMVSMVTSFYDNHYAVLLFNTTIRLIMALEYQLDIKRVDTQFKQPSILWSLFSMKIDITKYYL